MRGVGREWAGGREGEEGAERGKEVGDGEGGRRRGMGV